jgi:hypothetical protein
MIQSRLRRAPAWAVGLTARVAAGSRELNSRLEFYSVSTTLVTADG